MSGCDAQRVHSPAFEAKSVLQPFRAHLDPAALDLTFTIRAGEWFMEVLSSAIISEIVKAAPRVRLRFAPKHEADPDLLREGVIDLEIGKRGTSALEVRTHFLFRDKYVGVARSGHSLLAHGKVTAKRFAVCGHVASTQLGGSSGPVDAALKKGHLRRVVQVVVPGFPDAMRVAASSDLIAVVPRVSLANALIKTAGL